MALPDPPHIMLRGDTIARLLGLHFNHYVSPSVCIHEQTLAGYFEFPNILFKSIVFKDQLRNKPHLHIKGANKLKVRFILLV